MSIAIGEKLHTVVNLVKLLTNLCTVMHNRKLHFITNDKILYFTLFFCLSFISTRKKVFFRVFKLFLAIDKVIFPLTL